MASGKAPSLAPNYEVFLKDTPYSWDQLMMLTQMALESKFEKVFESARENKGLFMADDWTDEEKQEHWRQNRHPFSIGFAANKISQLLAAQRSNRTQVKFTASNASSPVEEVTAEILNAVARDAESPHKNNFKYLESDIFAAGIAVKHGVIELTKGFDQNLDYYTKFKRIDIENFLWDPNSSSYEHEEDCLWQCKVERLYRYQLRERMIMQYGEDKGTKIANSQPLGNYGYFGKKFQEYYIGWDKSGNRDVDIIAVFTLYIKAVRKYYTAILGGEVLGHFRSPSKAWEALREAEIPYILSNKPIESDVVPNFQTKLDKYVFTASGIIDYEETDMELFPFSVYHAFQFENDWWSLADVLKSPQKYYDRMLSLIDYAFGTDVKNAVMMNDALLAESNTPEEAAETLTKTGGVVHVKSTAGEEAIKPIQRASVDPNWTITMSMMAQIIDMLGGGAAISGRSQNPREGWQATALKQQAGFLFASLFMDNLNRWKHDLYKKFLWFEKKYDTDERVIKVIGDTMSQELLPILQEVGVYKPSVTRRYEGYLRINDKDVPATLLSKADVNIEIGDAPMSDTDRQSKLAELAELNKMYPGIVTPDMWMEYSDVSYTVKRKASENYKNVVQQNMQAKQFDQSIEEGKLNVSRAKVLSKMLKQQ